MTHAELEPVWNAAMERAGTAPGLSAYEGSSSLRHSANWERFDQLEAAEMSQYPRGNKERGRGRDRKPRKQHEPRGFYDANVLEQLKKGCSYGAIIRELGCSMGVVRRVARLAGMDRSQFKGANSGAGAAV
jgi:hypothetical protein